jgi:hypothetical protein
MLELGPAKVYPLSAHHLKVKPTATPGADAFAFSLHVANQSNGRWPV